AHRVIEAMIEAAAYFDNRLPELFGGFSRDQYPFPVSYPTSCSPQAWAAASPLLILRSLLRFEPDIRNARLHLAPVMPEWIGNIRLDGVPIMGGRLNVEVEGDRVVSLEAPPRLSVVSHPRTH